MKPARATCLESLKLPEKQVPFQLGKLTLLPSLGIKDQTIVKDESITQDELLALIDNLNKDNEVDGMLVQLPLPPHIDEKTIVNAVHPSKDVDGFNVLNIGR